MLNMSIHLVSIVSLHKEIQPYFWAAWAARIFISTILFEHGILILNSDHYLKLYSLWHIHLFFSSD